MSQNLRDFKNLVFKIKDKYVLSAAEDLLKDMLDIVILKEKLELLEENLYVEAKRAMFALNISALDKEELRDAFDYVKGVKSKLTIEETKQNKAKQDLSSGQTEDDVDFQM